MLIPLIFSALTACSGILNGRGLADPSDLEFKSIRFSPPEPERVVLKNGMVVYLLEDHELPLINMSALIRTGSVYEPPDLAGLAALTGTVMRTGGTNKTSSDEIDQKLDLIGAALNVSIAGERGSASLSVLKKDFDIGLDILSQVMMEPAFEAEKLAIAKDNLCQSLRRIKENPQSLAFREFRKLLYNGNPRGNLPTIASVNKITRSELQNFHNMFFHPNRILIAISGDFSRNDMLAKINKYFAGWTSTDRKIPTVSVPEQIVQASFNHLQDDIPQTTIVMGHLAPQKSHSDYFSFQVLNYILGGGGFSSRLMAEIRSARGLAYSVGSFYRADIDYGVFGAYCMTKTTSTHQALALIFDIIKNLKQGGVSIAELDWAKESLLNSFIFSYSSSFQIVAQQRSLEYDNLPPDFLQKTPDKIKAVTIEDLKRVAGLYLHPSRMLVLTVGDRDKFDRPLTEWGWGPVKTISSDIREGS